MDSALVEQASQQFLDQWKLLVSTTNWDKGRIICQWRQALIDSGAPAAEYSDDAWSRRVGHVTPQHVGRLRRAYERFGGVRQEYPGLYWSHFQAALDWDDAELWLEGAVQNHWSISQMRDERWQATGAVEQGADEEQALVDEAWDEDADPPDASDEVVSGTLQTVAAPPPAVVDDEPPDDLSHLDEQSESDVLADAPCAAPDVRPFAHLPPLPADVNDAFEAFKLCILHHRLAGWREISRDDLVASLDALKVLALAPAAV